MLAVPQMRKREYMLLILSNTPISKHLCFNPHLNIHINKCSQNSMLRFMYRKVASSNTSRLEGFFRLLMKGIFDPYVL